MTQQEWDEMYREENGKTESEEAVDSTLMLGGVFFYVAWIVAIVSIWWLWRHL